MSSLRRRRVTRSERRRLEKRRLHFATELELVPPADWPGHCETHGLVHVWLSREYLVQEYAGRGQVLARLTVSRTDHDGEEWSDGISWEALQAVKSQCGFGAFDAVEIFPAEADVVNVANLRHLWVLRRPLAFKWRRRARR